MNTPPKSTPDSPPLLCALGTRTGHIFILNLYTFSIDRCLAAHDLPIRGLSWIDTSTVLSYATDEVGTRQYRNSVRIADVSTGRMREVRSEKNKDQWAIRGVSLSWRRQYMVVLFKDGYDYEYEYEYEYVYEGC